MKKILKPFNPLRTLKASLGVYFIPVCVLPVIIISFYTLRVFEKSIQEFLIERAKSERDILTNEIDQLELELSQKLREISENPLLKQALKVGRTSDSNFFNLYSSVDWELHLFNPSGGLVLNRKNVSFATVPVLASGLLQKLRKDSISVDRFFPPNQNYFVTVIRLGIKEKSSLVGVLEGIFYFDSKVFSALKQKRKIDLVLMNRSFNAFSASFALSKDMLKDFSTEIFRQGNEGKPVFLNIGSSRFAAFLYDFPSHLQKTKNWGYLGLFLPMTEYDQELSKIKLALVYLTVLLILIALLLIFVFSNRLVKPIELLVSAMKRMKNGRVEMIPLIHSSYEIEYLLQSFNDMAKNIQFAKEALEQKIEELGKANSEIRTAQSTLVQTAKMASLGQIVAGVAHELNNPIGFIYSNMHHLTEYTSNLRQLIELYRSKIELLPPADREKILKKEVDIDINFLLKDLSELSESCMEGASRVKEIVQGLRSFSRADESHFKEVSIPEGIRSTLRLLTPEYKDKVKVHESYESLPLVECNLSQINQVFMNLISNAIQAIGKQGNIWIAGKAEGDKVVFTIEDDGTGIDQGDLEKVFDPFFTTKKVGEGTGLGLSIVYGIIQKHNGKIEVSSEKGKGTRFKITLPVRQR